VLYQHRPNQTDYSTAFDDVIQHYVPILALEWLSQRQVGYTFDYPSSLYDLFNLAAQILILRQ